MTYLNQHTKQISKEETLFEKIYRLAKEKDEDALTEMVEKGVCLSAFQGGYSLFMLNPIRLLAKEGDTDSVEFLINQFKACRNDAVAGYARGGHVEQVNQLIAQGASRDFAVQGYSFSGHVEQVNQLIARGVNLNSVVIGYAFGGHVEQVEQQITQGGANNNSAVYGYALCGHVAQVNQQITEGGASRNRAVYGYAFSGHVELVNELIERGADHDKAVEGYINGGHVEQGNILHLMTFTDDKKLRTLLAQAAKQRNDAIDVIALQEEATRLNEIAASSQNKIASRLNKIRGFRQDYQLDYNQAQSLTKIGTRAWLLQGPQLVRDGVIPPEIYFHITSYLGLFSHYNNSAKTHTAIEKARTVENDELFIDIVIKNNKDHRLRLHVIEKNNSNDPELRRIEEEQYSKEIVLNEIRHKNRQSF